MPAIVRELVLCFTTGTQKFSQAQPGACACQNFCAPVQLVGEMANASSFSILPSSLTLGAVLARGKSGVVVYQADQAQSKVRLEQVTDSTLFGSAFTMDMHCYTQVAVKKLHTSAVSAAAEIALLEEVQTLQLASATCQRVCRMLGCCKLEGSACIVMSL